ncbi:MAG TPA: hypothetical protein VF415_05155 [Rhodanobacter sp.]
MDALRQRSNTWWQAAGLFAACVALVLASVGDLRQRAPSSAAFEARAQRAEGGRELLQVANGQDGSVRLYDVRDGRLLSVAAADAE